MDGQDSTYYSPAMAALPPPAERRRPRPGSLARPVNGRLYRGTWLLVALPAARDCVHGGAARAAAGAAAAAGVRRRHRAPTRATTSRRPASGPLARIAGRARGGGLAARAARAVRLQRARGPLRGVDSRARPARARQPDRGLARPLEPGDRRDGAPRQHGHRARRERQRLRHRCADRARPLVRHERRAARPDGRRRHDQHARLPLHRRRRLRRARGGALRGKLALPRTGPWRSSTSSRSPARARPGSSSPATGRARRRRRSSGRRPRASSSRPAASSAVRARSSSWSTSGFPFTLYEQGPFVGRGISAITLTTAGAAPALVVHGHAGAAEPAAADRGRPLGAGARQLARPGPRARPGHAELRLPRLALRARLGDPALARRCAAALPVRRRRPVRALPAPAHPHRARAAQLPQPARLLALDRRCSSSSSRSLAGWGDGPARPLSPESAAATTWPTGSLVVFGLLALAGWLVARDRLLPRRAVTPEEELAGHTAALLALGGRRPARRRRRTRSRCSSSCPRCTPGSGSRRCARARPGCARASSWPASQGRCCCSRRSRAASSSGSTRPGTSPSWSRSATSSRRRC